HKLSLRARFLPPPLSRGHAPRIPVLQAVVPVSPSGAAGAVVGSGPAPRCQPPPLGPAEGGRGHPLPCALGAPLTARGLVLVCCCVHWLSLPRCPMLPLSHPRRLSHTRMAERPSCRPRLDGSRPRRLRA